VRIWLWAKRALLGLFGVIVTTGAAGAAWQAWATRRDLAATPAPGRLVDVGGHRLHIWCLGNQSPTVILEGGLGGSTAAWGFVQPEVAAFTRVCAYDRAGLGYSDPGPRPRTARRIAGELDRLLGAAGVEGPVVIAGASIGGLFARFVASQHEARVAGLVLVDASHEDQPVEIPQIAPVMPWLARLGAARAAGFSLGLPAQSLPPDMRGFARATRFRTAGYEAAVSELTHLPETAAEVKAARRELAVPLVVVTAGLGSDAAWRDLQRDQVGLSSRGCQVVAELSGHAVPIGQPEVVVSAVRAVVDAVRGGSGARPCR
jgi:pimeloyl-ACP methyl ester carboxylesterase